MSLLLENDHHDSEEVYSSPEEEDETNNGDIEDHLQATHKLLASAKDMLTDKAFSFEDDLSEEEIEEGTGSGVENLQNSLEMNERQDEASNSIEEKREVHEEEEEKKTEMDQEDLQRYLSTKHYYKIVRKLLGSQIDDDNTFDLDDPVEQQKILELLRRKHPNAVSFEKDSESKASLVERLLEFELETIEKRKKEYIKQRRSLYTKVGAVSSTVISSIKEGGYDVRLRRKLREQLIRSSAKVKKMKLPNIEADYLEKESLFSLERRNTRQFMTALIKQYYLERKSTLKMKKYKVLNRWSRYCDVCQIIDRTEQLFSYRVKKIDKEFESVSLKIDEIAYYEKMEKNCLQSKDFQVYIRSIIHDMTTKKRLDRFYTKMKWIPFSEGYEMIKKSLDAEDAIKEIPIAPQMTISQGDVEEQLDELKQCFDLKKMNIDGGQEFLYAVSKRFSAVFNSQCSNSKFHPYPYQNKQKVLSSSHVYSKRVEKNQDQSAVSPENIYLKPFPKWNRRIILVPQISEIQEKQYVLLNEIVSNIDVQLQVEVSFLSSTDLSYTTKRLKESAENHAGKSFLKYQFSNGSVLGDDNFTPPPLEGGKATVNKLCAIYLLRYIRIREFKRKLLDIFNYFRSLQRRLILDVYGFCIGNNSTATNDHDGMSQKVTIDPTLTSTEAEKISSKFDPNKSQTSKQNISFTAKTFTEIEDLIPQDGDGIFSHEFGQNPNRDDKYDIINKGDLVITDSNGIKIMYEEALKDVEEREEELLRIGSYYIFKNNPSETEQNIDRFVVLEDLYESETWFQDAKRKVIDCFMEAYEHSYSPKEQYRIAQEVLNLIFQKPLLDLSSKYFSESYASEIIGMELYYSLLRDIITSQISDERNYVKYIYKQFDTSQDFTGHPDNLIDDPRLKILLFPGSIQVGFLDFFTSLSHLGYIQDILSNSLEIMKKSFNIDNVLLISSLKRILLQQAIVEWKLLTEEDKIQRNIKVRMSNERRALEEPFLMEDADALINLVLEYSTEDRGLTSQLEDAHPHTTQRRFSVKHEEERRSEGGYLLSEKDYFLSQSFSNMIEAMLIWKTLQDKLYETDIVQSVYKTQCSIMVPQANEQIILESLNFEEQNSNNANSSMNSKSNNKKEIISLKTMMLSNLAISEFDLSMAKFDFVSIDGIKKTLESEVLTEFRNALYFQAVQLSLYSTVVRYNQIALDDFFLKHQSEEETFITTIPSSNTLANHVNQESSFVSKKKLKEVFFSITKFKAEIRERVLQKYQSLPETFMSEKGGMTAMLSKRVRRQKYNLLHEYSADIMRQTRVLSMKIQAIYTSIEITKVATRIQCVETGFIIGEESDPIIPYCRYVGNGESNEKTKCCLLAKDGSVVNPLYVPHYMQIMKTNFSSANVSDEKVIQSSQEYLFEIFLKILMCNYTIFHFLHVHCQMTQSSSMAIAQGTQGLDRIHIELKSLQNELQQLADSEKPSSVYSFLLTKCENYYLITLLTLKNSINKFQVKGNENAANVAQNALELLENPQYFDDPCARFWPLASLLDKTPDDILENSTDTFSILHKYSKPYQEIFPILKRFLLLLSEAERNYYSSEEVAIEIQLSDFLSSEKLYCNNDPSLDLQNSYLYLSLTLLQLKDFFLDLLAAEFPNLEASFLLIGEDIFKSLIEHRAKILYDRIVQQRQKSSEKNENGSDDHSQIEALKPKKRRLKELMEKEISLIHEEINKRLIHKEISRAKSECKLLRMELQKKQHQPPETTGMNHHIKDDARLFTSDGKLEIFHEFLAILMKRGAKSRNKTGDTVIAIHEKDLQVALDIVGTKLKEWKDEHINSMKSSFEFISEQFKQIIFTLEQKLKYQDHMREIDRKSFLRRVQSEVADKNYDLVFQVDSLSRKNDELNERLQNLKEEAKIEVRREYEDIVRKLTKELMVMRTKFISYRRNLFDEIENKFSQVKDEAMLNMKSQESYSTELKKRALKIVVDDNEMNQLKQENERRKTREMKLMVIHKLKLVSLNAKYEKRIRELEELREKDKEKFYGNKQQLRERENLLRQELIKAQQALSNTEMEVEQLRSDLQLQIKNKQKLVSWKVKNQQLLDQLEEKVEKYERWNQFDVDKLLLELEKKRKEVKHLSNLETKMNRKAELIEKKNQRKIDSLAKKLKKEQELKSKAYGKLDLINHADQEGDAGIWQKKYFDAMSELQIALREVDILKSQMDRAGLEIQSVFSESHSARKYASMSTGIITKNNHNSNVALESPVTTSRKLESSQSERFSITESRPPTRDSKISGGSYSVKTGLRSASPSSVLVPQLQMRNIRTQKQDLAVTSTTKALSILPNYKNGNSKVQVIRPKTSLSSSSLLTSATRFDTGHSPQYQQTPAIIQGNNRPRALSAGTTRRQKNSLPSSSTNPSS